MQQLLFPLSPKEFNFNNCGTTGDTHEAQFRVPNRVQCYIV